MKSWWRWILPFGDRLALPPRSVRLGFYAVWGTLMAYFMLSIGISSYNIDVAKNVAPAQAALEAVGLAGLLALSLTAMGGLYFLIVCMFTSVIIPDTVKVVRAVPGAWRSFCSGCGAAARWTANAPANLRKVDWLFVLAFSGMLGIFASTLYFAWPLATAVYNWLPDWFHTDRSDWMLIFIFDWVICIIPNVLLTSVWMSIMRGIVRRVRPKQ